MREFFILDTLVAIHANLLGRVHVKIEDIWIVSLMTKNL